MTDHDNVDVAMTRAGDPSPAQTASAAALPPSAPNPTPYGFWTFVPYSQVPGAHPRNPLAAASPGADPAAPAPVVAGIPQGLAVMLRHTAPWSANQLYSVVPTGTLSPVDEVEPAPEWYVVYRGRYVGVVDQYMQAHWAIRSVSNAAHKSYTTQAYALEAFNKVLAWGGVEVRPAADPIESFEHWTFVRMSSPVPPPSTFAKVVALVVRPENPHPLSNAQLEALIEALSYTDHLAVIELLGMGDLARGLAPLMPRLMAAAKAQLEQQDPADDNEIDALIRHFDLTSIDGPGTGPFVAPTPARRPAPPAPGPAPTTPVPPQSAPPPPAPAPSTPIRAPIRGPVYHLSSPQGEALSGNWLEAGHFAQSVPGGSATLVVKSPKARKPAFGAYCVFFGTRVGVFERWNEVQPLVAAPRTYQCGYASVEAARRALDYARAHGWTAESAVVNTPSPVPSSYQANPLNAPPRASRRWYVVTCGVNPGIYSSGLECHINVAGVSGALYQSFSEQSEAEEAFAAEQAKGSVVSRARYSLRVVLCVSMNMCDVFPSSDCAMTNSFKRHDELVEVVLGIAFCNVSDAFSRVQRWTLWSQTFYRFFRSVSRTLHIHNLSVNDRKQMFALLLTPHEPQNASLRLGRPKSRKLMSFEKGNLMPRSVGPVARLLFSSLHGDRKPPTQQRRRRRPTTTTPTHRDEVNAKARERMRRRREQLKNAPTEVQEDYRSRSREYNATYRSAHFSRVAIKARIRALKAARRERIAEAAARLQ
ncbi:hypothetical protein B0H16DRAFT_1477361 [Mycena metata]|uniref:Ribonuclease H1 N-terminal domain-containing protein n=1 Tax=Mycena metata TaxID=1033252 RepID=A0AAD7H967_9AGAR|nr:hypothetical protein B0H16DRAFT_1477361 [Mycena metata]